MGYDNSYDSVLTLIINANFDFCALAVFQIKGFVFMPPVWKSGCIVCALNFNFAHNFSTT